MVKAKRPRTKRFLVTMSFDLELAEDVIERGMSEDFANYVYRLGSPTAVAEHLGFNLVRGNDVHELDGFADRRDWLAELDWKSVELDAIEWKDQQKKRRTGPPKRK